MELEKEFVPLYDLVVALKELGFDKPCLATIDQTDYLHINGTKRLPRGSMMYDTIDCPTFSQAFRFFREKYGYFTSPTESDDDTSKKYDWVITKNLGDGKMFIKLIGYKNSYEEAELECLKKLIEIVKERK